MKPITFIALMLLPFFAFSQKKIDVVKLSNGKTIVVYDDKTWEYQTEIQSFAPSTKNKTAPATSRPPIRSTTPAIRSTSTSSQCTGTTQKGLRCKRMVKGGGRCYQH